jgi:hypothetical protein
MRLRRTALESRLKAYCRPGRVVCLNAQAVFSDLQDGIEPPDAHRHNESILKENCRAQTA